MYTVNELDLKNAHRSTHILNEVIGDLLQFPLSYLLRPVEVLYIILASVVKSHLPPYCSPFLLVEIVEVVLYKRVIRHRYLLLVVVTIL